MATRKNATTSHAPTKKSVTKGKAVAAKNSTSSLKMKENKSSRKLDIKAMKMKVLDKKNRRSLYLAIGAIVIVVILYLVKGFFVAALVNGQPVSRLSIIHDLETQSGKAALDAVVTKTLVFQEANKKHVTVSDKEIDTEIAKIQKQFQSQGQNLDQLLSTQGLTKDKFRDEVKVQLLVQKILGDQVKVSDKEFNDFLAQNKSLIAGEKDQNAAKASLKDQLEQQKLAQKYQEWIANLKKTAKIDYFVSY